MPRFKNTSRTAVHTPAGTPVAPGKFTTYDGDDNDALDALRAVPGLVEVPEPRERTLAELKELADARGVDITGLTKKADIAAAIAAKEEQS